MFPRLETSLLSCAQTDGQAALHLIYRTKHSGLQGLETPMLGWTQTCIRDRLGLPAGLIPDKMMSQDQAWPLVHGSAQVPELRAGCEAPSVLPGKNCPNITLCWVPDVSWDQPANLAGGCWSCSERGAQ